MATNIWFDCIIDNKFIDWDQNQEAAGCGDQ